MLFNLENHFELQLLQFTLSFPSKPILLSGEHFIHGLNVSLCLSRAPRGNTSRLQIAYLRVTQWQASWVQPQLTWDDVGRHLLSLPKLLCAQDLLFREGLGKAHRCPRTWLAVPVRIRGLSLYKVERCLCVPLPLLIEEKGEFGNELRARSTTCCFLKWDLKQLAASLTQVHKLFWGSLTHWPTCLLPPPGHNEIKGKISGKTRPI